MAHLSVIIPAESDVSALEDTLVSVLTHRPDHIEVIVPHMGSYDDPYSLGDEIRLLECAAKNANELIASALEVAVGEFVLVLQAGCEVADDWWEQASAHFDDAQVASVSPVISQADSHTAKIAGVAKAFSGRRECDAEARLGDVLGPTAYAGFYRKAALEAAGGWPGRTLGQLTDIDIALSLAELGFDTAVAQECEIQLCECRPAKSGAFRRAVAQEQLFWRHESTSISRALRPVTAAVQCLCAGSPWAMAGAVFGKLYAMAGKGAAKRHRETIASSAAQLRVVATESSVRAEAQNSSLREAA